MNRQPGKGWMRGNNILGAVIAGMCGLALYWLLSSLQEAVHPTLGDVGTSIVAIGVLALVGAVAAYLVRSWWAIVIVPACFLVFWYIGGVIDALLPGRLYKPWELSGLPGMLGVFALYILPPLLIGAAVGAAASLWMQRLRPSSS